jgi:hypothetical protein
MGTVLIIIAIAIILILGRNAPTKIYKLYKAKYAKPNQVKLNLVNGNVLLIENIRGTLNESVINNSLKVSLREGNLNKTYRLTDEQIAFIQKSENKNLSIYTVNTFKSYESGFMQEILSDSSIKVEAKDFHDFVGAFSDRNTWKQDSTLDLNSQMNVFFQLVVPEEGEALVGFAERQVITTHRFIQFSDYINPVIERIIPVSEIESYTIIK